jgi:hypothetical protein
MSLGVRTISKADDAATQASITDIRQERLPAWLVEEETPRGLSGHSAGRAPPPQAGFCFWWGSHSIDNFVSYDNMRAMDSIVVTANWDPEARVWVASARAIVALLSGLGNSFVAMHKS